MNAGTTAFGWWGRASCTRCVNVVGLSSWATAVCKSRSAEPMAAAAYQAFGFDGRMRQYCLAFLAFRAAQTCVARSEEHTSELQSLMRISYAVFCLKKKKPTAQK